MLLAHLNHTYHVHTEPTSLVTVALTVAVLALAVWTLRNMAAAVRQPNVWKE